MGKSIAVFGTCSNTGKTTIVAAMCRYFSEKGQRVFPFKAFNLSANDFELDGRRIGAAQYIQAAARGREYDAEMNPVFKKYDSGKMSYFINGIEKDLTDLDSVSFMRETSSLAYKKALHENDLVIVEGSGSCCELNLKDFDVANMHFALKHNVPVIIVGNIANGGIFGSLYGTLQLFSKEERQMVAGVIVNKFTGDTKRFDEGKDIIEQTCGVKVVSVMPYVKLNLPEEDSGVSMSLQDIDRCDLQGEIQKLTDAFKQHTDLEYLEKIVKGGAL